MKRNCSSLKQVLQQNEHLKVLDLSHNDLEGGCDTMESLCVCRRLQKLGMYNCTLDDTCLPHLAKVINNNRGLKELNLSRNPFESHSTLFEALSKAPNLEKLYMKRVGLTRPILPRRGLFDNLDTNDGEEDEEIAVIRRKGVSLEESFASLVVSVKRLRVLEMGRNELWPRMLEAMIKTNSLEKLFIYDCQLKYECVPALTEVVKANKKLRILDLAGNEFAKTRELFETLEESQISSVDLRNLKINDQKIHQIVSLIQSARKQHKINKSKPETSGIDRNKGLDHIMISDNSELTVKAFEKMLDILEPEVKVSSPGSARSTSAGSRSKSKSKFEIIQQLNALNLKPLIH